MIGWQPLTHIRWQEKRLVIGAGAEAVGHSRSDVIALLDRLLMDPSLSTTAPGSMVGGGIVAGTDTWAATWAAPARTTRVAAATLRGHACWTLAGNVTWMHRSNVTWMHRRIVNWMHRSIAPAVT
jgi:hypothetical protein